MSAFGLSSLAPQEPPKKIELSGRGPSCADEGLFVLRPNFATGTLPAKVPVLTQEHEHGCTS